MNFHTLTCGFNNNITFSLSLKSQLGGNESSLMADKLSVCERKTDTFASCVYMFLVPYKS